MKKTHLVSLVLVSLAANTALVADGDDQGRNDQWRHWNDQRHQWQNEQRHDERSAVSAPEIDPGQAMGALVLLGGTMAIIRGYRRNKK